MGKTSASIKLIQLLSARGDYVSTIEISEVLNTNKRNIREYIKEIEEAGYIVESKRGLTGGYKLVSSSNLPSIKLSFEEIDIIKDANNYLLNSEYDKKMEFDSIVGKILSTILHKDEFDMISFIDRFPLSMDKTELINRYIAINNAISDQYKIELEYRNNKNELSKYTINPYKLFTYNGNWFLLGYNEDIMKFGYYKLNRIENYYKTRYHFIKINDFDERDYLDEFGMTRNGEFIHVEFILTNLNVAIKERIYGKNQVIDEIDDNTIKLSCDMQNKDMIKSFVMSFGSKIKILEPLWLKEEIKEELIKSFEVLDND